MSSTLFLAILFGGLLAALLVGALIGWVVLSLFGFGRKAKSEGTTLEESLAALRQAIELAETLRDKADGLRAKASAAEILASAAEAKAEEAEALAEQAKARISALEAALAAPVAAPADVNADANTNAAPVAAPADVNAKVRFLGRVPKTAKVRFLGADNAAPVAAPADVNAASDVLAHRKEYAAEVAAAAPGLTQEQRTELARLVEAGPQAAGFASDFWSGEMLTQLVFVKFGVDVHAE